MAKGWSCRRASPSAVPAGTVDTMVPHAAARCRARQARPPTAHVAARTHTHPTKTKEPRGGPRSTKGCWREAGDGGHRRELPRCRAYCAGGMIARMPTLGKKRSQPAGPPLLARGRLCTRDGPKSQEPRQDPTNLDAGREHEADELDRGAICRACYAAGGRVDPPAVAWCRVSESRCLTPVACGAPCRGSAR